MKNLNLKVYLKKRKQRLSMSGVSPKTDWFIIIGFSLVLFLVGFLYTGYLYIKVNNDSLFETVQVNESEQTNIKKQHIEDKIKLIEQRNFDESITN